MPSEITPAFMEAAIRRYFDACNAGDYAMLVDCFTDDAVHYFPPGLPDIPWRTSHTIASKWVWCVEQLGSQWSIEKILCSSSAPEAVIELTHWKRKSNTALRGDEWYVFDVATGKIKEIRAYYASSADQGVALNQLVDFDYHGRGYRLAAPE